MKVRRVLRLSVRVCVHFTRESELRFEIAFDD
jgi:hypothetical protein